MFHFLPIAVRYDGTVPAAGPRLPGARRARCTPTRAARCKIVAATRAKAGAAVQLPLDRPGPARVDGGGARRAAHPRPARVRAVQRRRALARAAVATDEEILEWVGATPRRRCTRRARRMGTDERRWSTRSTMRRARHGGPARRGRLGVPVRHEREHLRAGDDDREKSADLILGNTPLPPEPGSTATARAEPRSPPSRRRPPSGPARGAGHPWPGPPRPPPARAPGGALPPRAVGRLRRAAPPRR